MKQERILFPDILRIIALFAVVVLHVSATGFNSFPTNTTGWVISNGFNSLTRFCVPIFVMVSGMFFLSPQKQITLKDIYLKYIFRIVTAFIFWSLFYAVIENAINNTVTVKNLVVSFLIGDFHLWFLFMIVGLYIATPFLRLITQQDRRLMEYFLILWVIFASVVLLLLNVMQLSSAKIIIDRLNLNFVLGYVGFYVAGYYFHTYELIKVQRIILYIAGSIGFICTFFLTTLLSWGKEPNQLFYGYLTPNVVISSIAVFVFVKEVVQKLTINEATVKYITGLSNCVFGAYLVHVLFLRLIKLMGFTVDGTNAVLFIPLESFVVFGLSLFASYILQKSKILRKYIL